MDSKKRAFDGGQCTCGSSKSCKCADLDYEPGQERDSSRASKKPRTGNRRGGDAMDDSDDEENEIESLKFLNQELSAENDDLSDHVTVLQDQKEREEKRAAKEKARADKAEQELKALREQLGDGKVIKLEKEFKCVICYEEVLISRRVTFPKCSHGICIGCMKDEIGNSYHPKPEAVIRFPAEFTGTLFYVRCPLCRDKSACFLHPVIKTKDDTSLTQLVFPTVDILRACNPYYQAPRVEDYAACSCGVRKADQIKSDYRFPLLHELQCPNTLVRCPLTGKPFNCFGTFKLGANFTQFEANLAEHFETSCSAVIKCPFGARCCKNGVDPVTRQALHVRCMEHPECKEVAAPQGPHYLMREAKKHLAEHFKTELFAWWVQQPEFASQLPAVDPNGSGFGEFKFLPPLELPSIAVFEATLGAGAAEPFRLYTVFTAKMSLRRLPPGPGPAGARV